MTKNSIKYIDRYSTCAGGYVFYAHYKNGNIEQLSQGGIDKTVKLFMARADFQFMQSKDGRYFHRFS